MKKKILTTIFTVSLFLFALVAQMTIDGATSKAEKLSIGKDKVALYEDLFKKLELKTTDGKTYKLSQVKEKLVLLNFWASWCLPCVKEFSTLKVFHEKYKNDILIIGLNNDDEDQLKEIKKMEKKTGISFPIYPDVDSAITNKFSITSIPATILYKNGKVIFFENSELDFMSSEFLDLVKKNLKD